MPVRASLDAAWVLHVATAAAICPHTRSTASNSMRSLTPSGEQLCLPIVANARGPIGQQTVRKSTTF
eukprot:9980091-Prorocentrum_lima.AAC.1